jgi:hypothetical protein
MAKRSAKGKIYPAREIGNAMKKAKDLSVKALPQVP